MDAARPLRDVFADLAQDEDARSAQDVLRANGHADLPDGLVAEAVGTYADTAPIEVAEHLSPYVMANSSVPLPDVAEVDPSGWLNAVVSAPVVEPNDPADLDDDPDLDHDPELHAEVSVADEPGQDAGPHHDVADTHDDGIDFGHGTPVDGTDGNYGTDDAGTDQADLEHAGPEHAGLDQTGLENAGLDTGIDDDAQADPTQSGHLDMGFDAGGFDTLDDDPDHDAF